MGCLSSKDKSPSTRTVSSVKGDEELRGRGESTKDRLPPSLGGKAVDPRYHMKLGLVGTSSSGKSTLAKQMRILHTKGFTEEERNNFKKILSDNLLLSLKELASQSFTLNITLENEDLGQKFKSIDPYKTQITPELVTSIQQFWADKGLQEVYKQRNKLDIPPNTEYCVEIVEKLSDPNYRTTEDDILRARIRSTGLARVEFFVKKTLWELVDPGGQRAERRKWPQFFDRVKGMIYVAALDDWDVVSTKVLGKTKLEESMDVFEDIINYDGLQETAWVLFLNKIDLFQKKIQTVNLQDTFPEYEGGTDVEKAVEFIKNMYLDLSNTIPREDIKVHVTCALDTTQVEKIFAAVRDFVASESLRKQGLGGF